MIDAHSHIKINDNEKHSSENINKYLLMLKENNIDETIVTVDPFIDKIKCSNDTSHFVKMKSGNKKNNLICQCSICKHNVYEGIDPYIKYNDFLIKNLSDKKNIHVFPVVSITPSTTQELINYYINKYGDLISGIKGYTGLSAYSLDQLGKLKSNLPLLVHCGTYDNQNPKNMIDFASKFNNYLILAHFGALNLEVLKKLNKLDNIIVDISPAKFIFDTYILSKRNGGVFSKEKINSIDDMYMLLTEVFDINKIVWGSDYPYSNQKEELETFLNTSVFSDSEKEKILSKNIKRVIK